DLPLEQRLIKKFLLKRGAELTAGKEDMTFKIRSWRYLIVTNKVANSETLYESDGIQLVPAKREWIFRNDQTKAGNVNATADEMTSSNPSISVTAIPGTSQTT
ncbi:unnamed protein product, partial [Allacma fusca]